jgi:hypothetical protein
MLKRQPNGDPIIRCDATMVDPFTGSNASASCQNSEEACDLSVTPTCTPVAISENHYAWDLKSYKSIPDFIREAGIRFGRFGNPNELGIYP